MLLQRVVLVAAVFERLVVDPAAGLIQLLAAEPHQVKRIRDLGRVGQHRVEHRPVGAGHVQRRPLDLVAPRLITLGQPAGRRSRVTAFYDVEQLPGSHVHDRGGPALGPPLPALDEQRLVQPERGHRADPIRVVDEPAAVGDDRVVDRVPVAAEIMSDLRDGAAVTPDLEGHPPPGPVGQLQTRRRDRLTGLGPRGRRTRPLGAAPAALVPHQHRTTSEAGQIGQRDPITVLDSCWAPARRALLDGLGPALDVDTQRVVVGGEHPHPRETNETFKHDGCTVVGHRSPDREVVLDTRILAGLLCTSTDLHPAHVRLVQH